MLSAGHHADPESTLRLLSKSTITYLGGIFARTSMKGHFGYWSIEILCFFSTLSECKEALLNFTFLIYLSMCFIDPMRHIVLISVVAPSISLPCSGVV